MQTRFIAERQIAYDGRQLAPHWIYRTLIYTATLRSRSWVPATSN